MHPANLDRIDTGMPEDSRRCEAGEWAIAGLFFAFWRIAIEREGFSAMAGAHRNRDHTLLAVEDRHEPCRDQGANQERHEDQQPGRTTQARPEPARRRARAGYAGCVPHVCGELKVVSQAVASSTAPNRPSSMPIVWLSARAPAPSALASRGVISSLL